MHMHTYTHTLTHSLGGRTANIINKPLHWLRDAAASSQLPSDRIFFLVRGFLCLKSSEQNKNLAVVSTLPTVVVQ